MTGVATHREPAMHPALKPSHRSSRRAWSLRAWVCGLLLIGAAVAQAQVLVAPAPSPLPPLPPLPIELFFRHADMIDAQLSPSGKHLAFSLNRNQRVALGVLTLESGGGAKLLVAYQDADVRRFEWVNDERLVYTVVDKHSGSGEQRFTEGLFVVAIDGSAARQLIQPRTDFFTGGARIGRQPLDWQHGLLFVPRTGGDEVIVGKAQWSSNRELVNIAPMRLNVVTQALRSLSLGMPERATGWVFDSAGEPRVASAEHQGQTLVHWRGPGQAEWRLLASMPSQARAWSPHSVDDAGTLYVVVPEGRAATSVLKRFDLDAKRPVGEALVRTPGFDFRGRLLQEPGGPVLGLRAETDAETTVWFDPALQRWQAAADARLPGRVNRLSCRRCASDDPVLLVQSWSDQHPGELFLFRPLRSPAVWDPVGRMRNDVDPRRMARLDFHRVKARDGLEIPVWVTQPPNLPMQATTAADPPMQATPAASASASASATAHTTPPRPAVVLVHGGPWVRGGHWAWNGEAQFLASRGYVVIEPEFRGSRGFGGRHFHAGRKQWGRAMQDDLADALQWAIGSGLVDGQRVCIAGGSYGGYAALMGPIRHPALYRCAAAWVAVTDPLLLFGLTGWSDMSDESVNYTMPQLIGDPQTDQALLTEVSPLAQAARLKVPVLLAYGAADRRVPLTHGERMRAALQAAGNEPEWVVYAEEGHGWLKAENRFDFARRLERFFAQHLK